jgi:CheY-like chemotaxis protein
MTLAEAKILVVDDEPALRDIFARWLKSVGCVDVRTAVDGVDALGVLDEHPVDLLITDVRMPRMDGVALVRRLGELSQTIPSIIFVSGFGDVDEREMYGLGVEAFLAKPLRLEELVAVIERALSEREALWQRPMEPPPRQTMEVAVCGVVVGPGGGEEESVLRLGRGGFSVRYPAPLSLGKVAFSCSCAEIGEAVTGQGFVRWRSRLDQRMGIEFTYLEEPSRSLVLTKLEEAHPRCFIPA